MTTDVLARARELLDAITPGEWTTEQPFTLMDSGLVMTKDGDCIARNVSKPDAAFIASAPPLVRDLCALAEAQQAEIARLRDVVHLLVDDPDGWALGDMCAYCYEPLIYRPEGEHVRRVGADHAHDCPVKIALDYLKEASDHDDR